MCKEIVMGIFEFIGWLILGLFFISLMGVAVLFVVGGLISMTMDEYEQDPSGCKWTAIIVGLFALGAIMAGLGQAYGI